MHRLVGVTVRQSGKAAALQGLLSAAGPVLPHRQPGFGFFALGWGHVGPVTARTVFAYLWGPRLAEAAYPRDPALFHPYQPDETRLTPPDPGVKPTAGWVPGCDRCGALEHLGWVVGLGGRLSLLCPTHQVAERERAYAHRLAELGVRSDSWRLFAALPPHAYRYLPDIC